MRHTAGLSTSFYIQFQLLVSLSALGLTYKVDFSIQ